MIRFRLISLLLGLWTILAGLPASAQNREVTGTVSDEAGPVVGATVIVKGSSVGTTTDANGSYRIEVPGTDAVLVFSFVGYETLELPVGSKTRVDAKFAQTSVEVEELVVVGRRPRPMVIESGNAVSVSLQEMEHLPRFLGTADPMRYLQSL